MSCFTCYRSKEDDNCGKKEESPVHVSGEHPTELVYLKELLKRLQDRHVECAQTLTKKAAPDTVSTVTMTPDAQNVLQTMMEIEKDKTRVKEVNKVALHVEKPKDDAEQQVESL